MSISTSDENPVQRFDRLRPATAFISSRLTLSDLTAEKETFHISLNIKDIPISFRVGDSIGIYGQNHPNLIDNWLKAFQATGEEPITLNKTGEIVSLRSFLTSQGNLLRLTTGFLRTLLEHIPPNPFLSSLLEKENIENLTQYLTTHEPLDLLREFSVHSLPPQALCSQLAPLLPRFYSIASSPLAQPNQIDLTVAHVRFSHRNEERFGVASHFLCSLAHPEVTPVQIYVQKSQHFTLPEDNKIPIIMIGPGTGVAPFRAFVQERVARGDAGKQWLFFGERHEKTHFFYEDFWKTHIEKNVLRLSTAFSRDQERKIYVQDRMLEQSRDLWDWIQEGAIVYICGDADRMAKQVETTWLKIFEQEGNLSPEKAKALLLSLRKQKRYLADVY